MRTDILREYQPLLRMNAVSLLFISAQVLFVLALKLMTVRIIVLLK